MGNTYPGQCVRVETTDEHQSKRLGTYVYVLTKRWNEDDPARWPQSVLARERTTPRDAVSCDRGKSNRWAKERTGMIKRASTTLGKSLTNGDQWKTPLMCCSGCSLASSCAQTAGKFLCGARRISAFSAFKLQSTQRAAEIRRGPQRGSKEEGSDYAEPSLEGPGRVDLPETALSLTSSRCISGSLPKRRSQISGLGWILRVQVFGPRRGLFVAMVTGGCRYRR